MSNKQLILPLYIVHKQAYRLKEKNIILLFLLAASVVSIFVIFKSLPSSLNEKETRIRDKLIKPRGLESLKNVSEMEFKKPVVEIELAEKPKVIKPIQNDKKGNHNLKRQKKVKEVNI